MVSDGKSKPELARLQLTMEVITLQRPEPVMVPAVSPTAALLSNQLNQQTPIESKERMVQITRDKEGGLGLSIKGGAEHKLPILISRIYKNHAADRTAQLFVGDAIIKVNGEYITACNHDDAVNILRNAGDIVVLTVKHYRAATPFLQKQCKCVVACLLYCEDENRAELLRVCDDVKLAICHEVFTRRSWLASLKFESIDCKLKSYQRWPHSSSWTNSSSCAISNFIANVSHRLHRLPTLSISTLSCTQPSSTCWEREKRWKTATHQFRTKMANTTIEWSRARKFVINKFHPTKPSREKKLSFCLSHLLYLVEHEWSNIIIWIP